jgi:hypothetical protein
MLTKLTKMSLVCVMSICKERKLKVLRFFNYWCNTSSLGFRALRAQALPGLNMFHLLLVIKSSISLLPKKERKE